MVIPSALPMRDYQQADVDNTLAALGGHPHVAWDGNKPFDSTDKVNRVAMVWATGLGKTIAFAHLCLIWQAIYPGQRIVIIVHRDELAQQAKAKIHSVAPHLRVGIVMGTRNEPHADVVIVSAQTVGPGLVRRAAGKSTQRDDLRGIRADDIRGVGLVIADEAHHSAAATWRAILVHFGCYDGVPLVGVTATLSREDGKGLGEIYQEVTARRDTIWGIRNGHLSDVRGIRVQVPQLDLSGVRLSAGDLAQEQVGQAMLDANTGAAIAKAVAEFVPTGRGPLFAPNVATCHDFAEELNSAGQRTEVVIGSTPLGERREIYDRFRTGETRWLANAMVLTEGWDAPWADTAIIARPTKSSGLYQQMVGRVLRPWPAGGKTGAVVLDVVGATTKHHLASLIDLSPDRPVRERQSVLEAWDEEDIEPEYEGVGWDQAPIQPVTKVIGTDVDLLAGGTPSPWLQTNGGTWFIPAGDLLFFLWPEIGMVDDLPTSTVEQRGGLITSGITTHTGLVTIGVCSAERFERSTPLKTGMTFELGMTWAEALAAEHRKPPTQKWREDMHHTQSIIKDARKAGLAHNALGLESQGQLYDAVSIVRASKRLDR